MLIGKQRIYTVVLPPQEKQRIADFLLGSVYCWCKTKKDVPFNLQLLLGGENKDWTGTPLLFLFERLLNRDRSNGNEAYEQAAKDAGRLLKELLANNEFRSFETFVERTRYYRWVP